MELVDLLLTCLRETRYGDEEWQRTGGITFSIVLDLRAASSPRVVRNEFQFCFTDSQKHQLTSYIQTYALLIPKLQCLPKRLLHEFS